MGEINELLSEGVSITLLGLGVVFVLLTLLVGVLHAMSALAFALGGKPGQSSAAATLAQAAQEDEELIAVIGAAIGHYRRNRLPAQRAPHSRGH